VVHPEVVAVEDHDPGIGGVAEPLDERLRFLALALLGDGGHRGPPQHRGDQDECAES
jgi:hypothetical protein